LAGVLAVGLWHERARVKPLPAGTAAAILAFAAIMLVHFWMTAGDGPAPGISSKGLTSTGFRMLLEDGFLPRSNVLLNAFLQNPATWMLILAGLLLAIVELRLPRHRRNSLVLLLLALPIVSVAFYANAWPYAYIVLMPTACLAAGHALSRYLQGEGDAVRAVSVAICLALVAMPMVLPGQCGWRALMSLSAATSACKIILPATIAAWRGWPAPSPPNIAMNWRRCSTITADPYKPSAPISSNTSLSMSF
jgi:hypothetical protein